MTENIELRRILSSNTNTDENEIQQYDEIKQNNDSIEETHETVNQKNLPRTVNGYDFFTQHNVRTSAKRKKSKNKDKSSNLMDIIGSEIAATTVPLYKNVITQLNDTKKNHSYLETTRINILKSSKPSYYNDTEYGWDQEKPIIRISPIFPRVLDNFATKESLYPVEYVEPILFEEIVDQNISHDKDQDVKFLDITLKDIKFLHHHSYSLEKLLSLKLEENYNKYHYLKELIKDIGNDIKVSRETKENLKKDFVIANPVKKDNLRFDPTIRKYTEKMLQSKEQLKQTTVALKEVTHHITSLWSDIQLIREKQGGKKTAQVLQIIRECLDEKELNMKWDEVFNSEFADMVDKIEFDYVSEYMKYKEVKRDMKSGMMPMKPKLHIDESMIKRKVENVVNDLVNKERVDFILSNVKSNVNFFVDDSNNIEINIHFKIYMDNILICESEHYSGNDALVTEFTESFSIQILPHNTMLQIVLFENGKKVSCIEINLSHVEKTYANSDLTKDVFVYDGKIKPDSNSIGSGFSIKEIALASKVRLKSSNLFEETLRTCCEMNIKVGWNDKFAQNHNTAMKASIEVGRKIKRLLHGIEKPDLKSILDVISNIYEQDVTDPNLVETVKNVCNMKIQINETFSADENTTNLIRLKLLHLRNTGYFTNVQNKMIPLYASQITTEQLDCLQKTKENSINMEYFNQKETEMDPIELQRFIGSKYVQKLNKNMLKKLNDHLLKKTHKDVVSDFNLSWRSMFSDHTCFSKLKTMSYSTKNQMLKECINGEQEIQVTVLRAFNLMDRSTNLIEDDEILDDDDQIAGFKVRQLRPFVRVSYKGNAAQTVTAIGCQPTWNHTLRIKTVLGPLSCLHINVYDEYKANIYEGVSEDDHSNKTVHYRYYNKWLGTLQVPLRTVLSLGTLRGTFKITTPSLIFGYETLQIKETTSLVPEIMRLMKKETAFITLNITTNLSHLGGFHVYNQPLPSSIEDDHLIKHLNNFVTQYTNEFPSRNISLTFIDTAGRNKCVTQFLQPIPLPEKDFLPKNPRGESAVSKSSGRSSSSSGRRKELDVDRVSHEEKESVYSTYDTDNLKKMLNACLRYVSLIPCYEVMETHAVTLLGLELLKVLHGSPLDHTILLASYFIYLGIKCWVAIGLGLPRGLSSYVLIKYDLTTHRIVLETDQLFRTKGFLNKNDGCTWYVCDATSGERFDLRDVGCPLKTIDYVFDNENIWVNLQASTDCENLSSDFSKSSDWQPVFDKSMFVMKQPVVTESALYCAPSSVEGLRQALETKVRMKVQKWRPHMKTIWNRYCSGLLRDMLPQWEAWAFNPTAAKPGFSHKLKQLMATYKIFGFPLNMGYLSTRSVTAAVRATGLHATDEPGAEFALAVEVYAYPNNVVSLWVFLACITRM